MCCKGQRWDRLWILLYACCRIKPNETCSIGVQTKLHTITYKIRSCAPVNCINTIARFNLLLPRHITEWRPPYTQYLASLLLVPSKHAISVSQGLGHYRSYEIIARRKVIISIVRKSWRNEYNRQEGEVTMSDRERKLPRRCKNNTWPQI